MLPGWGAAIASPQQEPGYFTRLREHNFFFFFFGERGCSVRLDKLESESSASQFCQFTNVPEGIYERLAETGVAGGRLSTTQQQNEA